jgi:hypothetical protein
MKRLVEVLKITLACCALSSSFAVQAAPVMLTFNYYQSGYYRPCEFCVSLRAEIFYDDSKFTASARSYDSSYRQYDFTVTGANVFISNDRFATFTPVNAVFTQGSISVATYIINDVRGVPYQTRGDQRSELFFSGGIDILPGFSLTKLFTGGSFLPLVDLPPVDSNGRLRFAAITSNQGFTAGASVSLRDTTGSDTVKYVEYSGGGSSVDVPQASVPLPSTLAMLAFAVFGLTLARKKR